MEDQSEVSHSCYCKGCERDFPSQEEIVQHNLIFRFKCSHCGKHFDTIGKRVNHMRLFHQTSADLTFPRTKAFASSHRLRFQQ
jgi:hypothetical protein